MTEAQARVAVMVSVRVDENSGAAIEHGEQVCRYLDNPNAEMIREAITDGAIVALDILQTTLEARSFLTYTDADDETPT